jgi:thiamine biosynthesis lipoprotein
MSVSGQTQGTTFHVTYLDPKERNLERQLIQLLIDFDLSVSTYNPNSIISKINRNEPKVKLDAYFTYCFVKAKEIWQLSNGAFDPTVYPVVNAWGFGPEKKSKLEQQQLDSLLQFVGFEKIVLVDGKIVKKDPRVQLDFNAFAQGYSVDVLSAFLLKKGIENFIVEIGGEVYTHGRDAAGNKWRIGLEQPTENKQSKNPLTVIFELENQAVATSGNYRRFSIENGVKIVHHIDPKTGKPTSNNLLSASVFTDACISSDALATAFLVMGLDESKRFLAQHPEIQVYLIYSDEQGNYQVYLSDKIADWIAPEQ